MINRDFTFIVHIKGQSSEILMTSILKSTLKIFYLFSQCQNLSFYNSNKTSSHFRSYFSSEEAQFYAHHFKLLLLFLHLNIVVFIILIKQKKQTLAFAFERNAITHKQAVTKTQRSAKENCWNRLLIVLTFPFWGRDRCFFRGSYQMHCENIARTREKKSNKIRHIGSTFLNS